MTGHTNYCRLLLEEIEAGNGHSQRLLSKQLGIALGLTNLLLKEILRKEWIQVVQVKPNRVAYLITPAGIAEKAQMSRDYLVYSARFYASARDRLREVLDAVAAQWPGPDPCRVAFYGAGEIAEIGFVCLQSTTLNLVGVADDRRDTRFFGLPVHRTTALQGQTLAGVPFDRLIVMALDDLGEVEQRLEMAAVDPQTVFWLRDWRWSNTVVAQQHIGPSRGVDAHVRAAAKAARPVPHPEPQGGGSKDRTRMITSNPAVRNPGALRAALDARARSAVSSSTYTVPSGFLWVVDVLMQCATMLAAWRLSPHLQQMFSAETAERLPWLSGLSLLPAAQAAGLRPLGEILWIPLVMVPVTLLFVQVLGGYRPLLEQSRTRVGVTSVVAPLFGLSVVALILITTRNHFTSRALIFSFTLLSSIALLTCRMVIRVYKHKRLLAGHYARNVVVIGHDPARRWLSRHFAKTVPPNLHRLLGYLEIRDGSPLRASVDDPDAGDGDVAPELPSLGDLDDLGDLLIHKPIHEVLVVQSPGAEKWLSQVIEQCEYFRVTLRLVPEALLSWQSRDLQVIFRGDPLQLPEIVLRPRFLDGSALFAKRVFDWVVSAILLTLLSPVFLIVALAIKITTPGLPVFYPWRVIGYKGRPFTGYKFTTMVADADDLKPDLMHLNEMQGPVFKIKDDPRITRLGRFLRKFSLNELPQLWSVLKGDMSLVGPRPAYPHELERYELWQKRKLCVQPGMTCLWQVRGRNKISNFNDWVRMDFEYIDNWSLWLDCRILMKTFWAVFAGSGS